MQSLTAKIFFSVVVVAVSLLIMRLIKIRKG
jgi:hypothetical protein